MTIDVDNVVIKRGERVIVDSVSFSLNAGEFLAIAGKNGSGKSTLLAAMTHELPIESGRISIDGKSLDEWSPRALARRRAVLPQESSLSFPFAVLDVVLMGRSAHNDGVETREDIRIAGEALKTTGLASFETRRYTSLSGGEKQRVHLARVLAQIWDEDLDHHHEPGNGPAKLLMLDEPTASQDLAAQHRVLSCARGFADRGAGVVCVLHDLNQVAQYADRVLLLSDGRPAALGTPSDVLVPEILESIYGVSVKVIRQPEFDHPIIFSTPS